MTRLKELRGNKTQSEIAIELGLPRETYRNYETGARQPDQELLIKIADYFDVSIDYLLGRSDERQPTASPPSLDEQLSGVDFALSGEIKDLSDVEKQDILDYIRFKKQKK